MCLTFFFLELEAKLEELKKKKIEKPAEPKKTAPKNVTNDEAELSEEEKAKLRSKPISSTAVPGTPWCVVWTRDKRVFFYNPSEKISLWERPQILVGRVDVDKMVKEVPANAEPFSQTNTTTAQPQNTAANAAAAKKTKPAAEADQPAVKKHKIQADVQDDTNSRGSSASPKSGGSTSPKNDRSMSPSRHG